jgi:hypothetical protein
MFYDYGLYQIKPDDQIVITINGFDLWHYFFPDRTDTLVPLVGFDSACRVPDDPR